MAKKGVATKVMLVSEGKTKDGVLTGYRYYVKKGKNFPEKLRFRKFDPRAWNEEKSRKGAHVWFNEKKLPPHKKN